MPATINRINPQAVRAPAGYNHAIEIINPERRVVIAGQVGVRPDGSIPDTAEGQIAQAYANLFAVLSATGLTAAHLVKTTVFLTDRAHLAAFRAERTRVMGDLLPASTLLFVSGLADPRFVVEIEAEAVA
ncbi:MAG: RidA family protein [Acetobacteraceae bacterium]